MAAAPSGGAAGHRQQVDHFRDGIQSYLESLSMHTFHRLFMSPATCLAMFRLLPSLAKQLVMSMLYVDNAPSAEDVKQWCLPAAQRKRAEELARLEHVHIVTEQDSRLLLNPTFRTELRNALTGGGKLSSFGMRCSTPEPNPVDIAFLDAYAVAQSEAILHFMVGSSSSRRPSAGVINLMKRSRLMAQTGEGELSITNKGFQFLLQDANTQVWAFLLQYLDTAEELQMDVVEVLHFLFQLGSMELGVDYSVETLTPTQLQMLDDLRDYGIVYQRTPNSRRFYPTRLATTLTSGSSAVPSAAGCSPSNAAGAPLLADGTAGPDAAQNESGYIIVETNYRVYAYTDSPLQIAVLNLFVSLCARFGNMVAGTITRESVRSALVRGITAEQIIAFLTAHAHPQMRKKDPLLPLTVVDQIRLWEMERNRLQCQPGHMYSQFAKQQDFDTVRQFAEDIGCVTYCHPKRRLLVVTPTGHEQVRAFVIRKAAERAAAKSAAK